MPTTTLARAPQTLRPWDVDNATRRDFVAGGLSLSLGALALAACTADEPDDAPDTVTIEHEYGTTEVPVNPSRVVTVGYFDQDPCFAVGVEPVAIRRWYNDQVVYPWARDAMPDADSQPLPAGELNFEAVADARPDLIIAVS